MTCCVDIIKQNRILKLKDRKKKNEIFKKRSSCVDILNKYQSEEDSRQFIKVSGKN